MAARGSRARRAVAAVACATVLLGLLSACSVDEVFAFGWPQGVTIQAQQMFDMWIGSVIAALAVGGVVWFLIFWCVVRYRRRASRELPVQTRYNLPIELIYTVIPFLIISVLFYYTVVVQTSVNQLSDDPDVVVTVEAFKWNWKFSYDGVQGPDGRPVATVGASDYVPVLVLPTDRTIRFVEHSNDVIHSFWVPDMLFKRDVFPGSVINQFETTIVEEGAYVGRCAELCGAYHSMMNFEVRAVTPEQYAAFLAAKQAGRSTPEALTAIGEEPLAVTTQPFPAKPTTSTSN